MTTAALIAPERRCAYCRTPLVRKTRASGPEPLRDFAKRRYCDMQCKTFHCKPKQPRNHPWVRAGDLKALERKATC